MSNSKSFAVTPGGGGGIYKPRVWINFRHERTEIGTQLAKLSMWRGADKRIGEWVSYECRPEQLDKAVSHLVALGFQKQDKLD